MSSSLRQIRTLIKAHNPAAKFIVTVSPVPLARTFSGHDVLVASTAGKAILHAAAFSFAAETPQDVLYYPSYEIVQYFGPEAFIDDGRHVRRDVVAMIVDAFIYANFENAQAFINRGNAEKAPSQEETQTELVSA